PRQMARAFPFFGRLPPPAAADNVLMGRLAFDQRHSGGNMKTKLAALSIAAVIAFAPNYAAAQVCAGGLIVAALIANFKDNRELTAKEAQTCGLLLGQDKANEKPGKPKQNPKPN